MTALEITGAAPGRMQVVFDDYTPLDLRAIEPGSVSKVVSLCDDGRSIVTIGAANDGTVRYLTLVCYGDDVVQAAPGFPPSPSELGTPKLDLAAVGFSDEGYETLSAAASIRLGVASDGFDVTLYEAAPDRLLDAGPVRFLLAGRRLVGVAVRGLSAEEVANAGAVIRSTGRTG